MNDYTPKILDILAYQQVITNQGENYTGEKDWALNKLKSLIADSIAQAEQEMLDRVEQKLLHQKEFIFLCIQKEFIKKAISSLEINNKE